MRQARKSVIHHLIQIQALPRQALPHVLARIPGDTRGEGRVVGVGAQAELAGDTTEEIRGIMRIPGPQTFRVYAVLISGVTLYNVIHVNDCIVPWIYVV